MSVVTITDTHLNNASCVLCHRAIHICWCACAPNWLHIQQILPGTFYQLHVLDPHPCQHHALWAVVATHVFMQQLLINLVHILHWAEAGQAYGVSSKCCLQTKRIKLLSMGWAFGWVFRYLNREEAQF